MATLMILSVYFGIGIWAGIETWKDGTDSDKQSWAFKAGILAGILVWPGTVIWLAIEAYRKNRRKA